MIGRGAVRTGIDLGGAGVKLVRGEGIARLERITHFGFESREPAASTDGIADGAAALEKLLAALQLRRGDLGRVAVSVGPDGSGCREVAMPELTDAQVQGALRFEARKHLNLDELTDAKQGEPVLAYQVLGPAADSEDGAREMKVLLAAVSRRRRQEVLAVLDLAGIDPEVIDLEPFAGLNALFSGRAGADEVLGLLDLGARQASLHVSGGRDGFFSRSLALAAPASAAADSFASYAASLRELIRETLHFYRGRFRREVQSVFLAGGGALLSGLAEKLREQIDRPIEVFDPLERLAEGARSAGVPASGGALFVTACGLCRWWDRSDV